jgi:membrane associated rhomboid family serine protease
MFRQKTGSVVCASCGSLVGVNDDKCYTCGRRNPGLWGFGPVLRRFGNDMGFVSLVVYGCIVIYAATLVVTVALGHSLMGGSVFNLLGPSQNVLILFGASGAYPLWAGRWWTVLSAGWLHGGALHILFNVMWIRQLGPVVADMFGSARMIIIYTIACACGFILSSACGYYLPGVPLIGGGQLTIGASAPIFGLLGALVHYGNRGGSSLVKSEALGYATTLFVFGLIMPGVDNAAHAGGFAGGYLASLWLDPLKAERMDHFIGAAVCLLLTAAAILWSILSVVL